MKPNILLIMTDQQSASMMSCSGNKYLKTPAMDYIAENGIRFERAYCTNPVCVASRFSLFTGKMPSYINLTSNDAKEVNLEKIEELKSQGIGHMMKDAGYEAVYGGKQHLPKFNAEDLGFDILTRDERDGLAEECSQYIKKKKNKPFFMVASFINPHDICYMAIRDGKSTEHDSKLVDRGRTELSNVDKFLNTIKDSDNNLINANCPPLPENYMPQQDEPEAIDQIIKIRPFRIRARENYSESRWRMHRFVYHKLTEMVDKKIEKLLEALKESGQEENTIIIFTSDHGDMDASHKMEHKSVLYEEACRIPFLICQKGVTPAGVIDNIHLITNGLDLIPTLCDYAEIEKPGGLEGASFRPVAEGKGIHVERESIKLESEVGRAVITKDFKYALYNEGYCHEQLYDLRKDPYETMNSAFVKENRDTLDYHRSLFKKMFNS